MLDPPITIEEHEPIRKSPLWFFLGEIIWFPPPHQSSILTGRASGNPLLCSFGRSIAMRWRVGSGRNNGLDFHSLTSCLGQGQQKLVHLKGLLHCHDFWVHIVNDLRASTRLVVRHLECLWVVGVKWNFVCVRWNSCGIVRSCFMKE